MGIRLVQGKYVQVRITRKGYPAYHQNFGLASPETYEYARLHDDEKKAEFRKMKLLGICGIKQELSSRTFNEVAADFFRYWKNEKEADGADSHTPEAIASMGYFVKYLTNYFGQKAFESIRPLDVLEWREFRVKQVQGTSVNREQAVLSSIFSTIERLIDLEKIKPFKLPLDPKTDKVWNPCASVEKAATKKRERIPTDYELKKLKLSFANLKDVDGWEICKLALKSILSEKDLRKLELGAVIDTERAKTGVKVHIPITILQKLNWRNWRKRFDAARRNAGIPDLQFRDLRKKGGNHLVGKHDIKLVSQYFGHASVKTTEDSYMILDQEKMRPLANDLEVWVEGL